MGVQCLEQSLLLGVQGLPSQEFTNRLAVHIGPCYVAAIPGAPPIPLVNSAFWRWIGRARPYCGRGEGFYVG